MAHARTGKRLATARAIAAGCLFLGFIGGARAFSFVPSEQDWALWPPYCRANYLTEMTPYRRTQWYNALPPSEVKKWRDQLSTTGYFHHYCHGLALLNAARYAPESERRRYQLAEAVAEFRATLERNTVASPFFAIMVADTATALELLGEREEAVRLVTELIEASPKRPEGYSRLALLYKSSGEVEKARNVLEKGVKATGGGSAEIHYHLGLLALDMGDIAAARKHADEAYRMGYPLGGLKKRLAELAAREDGEKESHGNKK